MQNQEYKKAGAEADFARARTDAVVRRAGWFISSPSMQELGGLYLLYAKDLLLNFSLSMQGEGGLYLLSAKD